METDEKPRTIHDEMHGFFSMVSWLANDPNYVYTPKTPEERDRSRKNRKLLAPRGEELDPVAPGTAELVRERALTDGPATPKTVADGERYTNALHGTWKGDHGVVACWGCDKKLLLIPRKQRVEAACLSGCSPFMVEAATDARLEAAGECDFRRYSWKRH